MSFFCAKLVFRLLTVNQQLKQLPLSLTSMEQTKVVCHQMAQSARNHLVHLLMLKLQLQPSRSLPD